MAIGALDAAEKMNYRVPEDFAIVGFANIPAASWVRPQLSTVAQFPDQMGTLLARAPFDRIQGEYNGPSRGYEVPVVFLSEPRPEIRAINAQR